MENYLLLECFLSNNGLIIVSFSFLSNCLLIKVGSFFLPTKGKMGARYKKFSPLTNRYCQFYIFLHVLCSIIEGQGLKTQFSYMLNYQ